MTAQNELSALISKTVEEQTFSLDAVKAIGAIRDRAIALEAELVAARKSLDERSATITGQNKKIAGYVEGEVKLVQREANVATRELKVTELERDTAVAKARHETLNSVFSTIFANRVVRENVTGNVPVANTSPNGGGYPITMPSTSTVDRTEG